MLWHRNSIFTLAPPPLFFCPDKRERQRNRDVHRTTKRFRQRTLSELPPAAVGRSRGTQRTTDRPVVQKSIQSGITFLKGRPPKLQNLAKERGLVVASSLWSLPPLATKKKILVHLTGIVGKEGKGIYPCKTLGCRHSLSPSLKGLTTRRCAWCCWFAILRAVNFFSSDTLRPLFGKLLVVPSLLLLIPVEIGGGDLNFLPPATPVPAPSCSPGPAEGLGEDVP